MADTPTVLTKEIFNATTQKVESAVLSVDANNEIIATFANDAFIKFPPGLDEAGFEAHVAAIHESSDSQEIITDELLQQQAQATAAAHDLLKAVGTPTPVEPSPTAPITPPVAPTTNPGNTMPAGDQTNVPATPSTPAS